MSYSIREFSKVTGLSIHTLRYYEYEGLITPKRSEQNRKCYSDEDIAWVEFLLRLKDTGMPIKEIRRYAKLRTQGESSIREKLEMLKRHDEFLHGKIRKLQEHKLKCISLILIKIVAYDILCASSNRKGENFN